MGAIENADDAAFGALAVGVAAAALKFCDHVVAVHGVVDGQARDENVAVQLGDGFIGHNETVAIVMEDQAATDFVACESFLMNARRFIASGCACDCCGCGLAVALALATMVGRRMLHIARGVAVAFAAGQAVATTGDFVDGAAFFEFSEHFEQGALVGFSEVQGARDFAGSRRIGANLQKTKDIVGI